MYLRDVKDGVELSVYVQPRATKTRVVGLHDGQLKIQLAAPPVDGLANEELIRFLSKQLGVPTRQVVLVSGETSRRKRVRVTGVDLTSIQTALG